MKTLEFAYEMGLDFSAPVSRHRFTLKCFPKSNRRQEITALNITVSPNEFLSEEEDAFGNRCIYGYAEQPHTRFSVRVEGRADTGLSHYETAAEEHRLGMYRYPSALTQPGEALRRYSAGFHFPAHLGEYARSILIMEQLYRDIRYVSGSTSIGTTAEQALEQGCGVCQDYSHIMLALCRLHHIPARYVVGMLMGEGLSHAWVEICEHGMWIGLDPTNNLVVEDQHIKLSCGRDYGDCTINQGVFTGTAAQTQTVSVRVLDRTLPPHRRGD